MKKTKIALCVVDLLLLIVSALLISTAIQKKSLYAETMKVISVEAENDGYLIEFQTSSGINYQYFSEDGDIHENEIYSILMNSRYTKTVLDDKIEEIKYTAF